MIWIVSLVCDENFGPRAVRVEEDVKTPVIRHFSACYLCSQGQTDCIGDEVRLGRKATF